MDQTSFLQKIYEKHEQENSVSCVCMTEMCLSKVEKSETSRSAFAVGVVHLMMILTQILLLFPNIIKIKKREENSEHSHPDVEPESWNKFLKSTAGSCHFV